MNRYSNECELAKFFLGFLTFFGENITDFQETGKLAIWSAFPKMSHILRLFNKLREKGKDNDHMEERGFEKPSKCVIV